MNTLTLITTIAAVLNLVITTYLLTRMVRFIRTSPQILFYAMFLHSLFTWLLLSMFVVVYIIIMLDIGIINDPGTYVLRPLMPMVFVQLTVSVAIETIWLSAMSEKPKNGRTSNDSVNS